MSKVSFNVDAYTARLIGRENVSKLDGAIIELIKNTYDADASICLLYFDDVENKLYIADNGIGMTEEIIKRHWMTIGRSSKKIKYKSGKGRIQTGAKGIGRFALDRIAEKCTMLTKTSDSGIGIIWDVDWSAFDGEKNITEVTADINESDISFEQFTKNCANEDVKKLINEHFDKQGTIFKLGSLHDTWSNDMILQLKENLSSLIPYELSSSYKIYCYYNGIEADKAEVFSNIDAFSYDYKIEYSVKKVITKDKDETIDEVSYKIWRNEFEFGPEEDEVLSGAHLAGEVKYFHGTPVEETCPFRYIISGMNNSIGEFSGVLYFTKLSLSAKDKVRLYQKDISGRGDIRDTFGGLKIYRDSFRVRPYGDPKSSAFDWLQLARRKNASPAGVADPRGSWRVSADQMFGSIFISRMNITLPDQSNREGIVETKEFMLLKEFTIRMIERLEQDRQHVCMNLAKYYDETHQVEQFEQNIKKKAEKRNSTKIVKKTPGIPNMSGGEKTIDDVDPFIQAQKVIDAKNEQIEGLENELKMLRVLATTGIVTNTYIHEFKSLTHKLNMKITMAKEAVELDNDIEEAGNYIRQADDIRQSFNSWFQVTIEAIKNDKRRRKNVDIVKTIEDISDSWNQTLKVKSIHISVTNAGTEEITLRCFPYEIEAIMNNLITNSVAAFHNNDEDKKINIVIVDKDDSIVIEYSDTGIGLTEQYKKNPYMILKAFETNKRNSSGELTGTGMGMWIVNNIVMEYDGKIDLDDNIKAEHGFMARLFFKK